MPNPVSCFPISNCWLQTWGTRLGSLTDSILTRWLHRDYTLFMRYDPGRIIGRLRWHWFEHSGMTLTQLTEAILTDLETIKSLESQNGFIYPTETEVIIPPGSELETEFFNRR